MLSKQQLGNLLWGMADKRAKIAALQRLKKSLMQNLLTGLRRLSPEAIAELTAEKSF